MELMSCLPLGGKKDPQCTMRLMTVPDILFPKYDDRKHDDELNNRSYPPREVLYFLPPNVPPTAKCDYCE